jgi:hypothetical protein
MGYFCFDNGVLTTYQLSSGKKRIKSVLVEPPDLPVRPWPRPTASTSPMRTAILVLAKVSDYSLLGENDVGEAVMTSAPPFPATGSTSAVATIYWR